MSDVATDHPSCMRPVGDVPPTGKPRAIHAKLAGVTKSISHVAKERRAGGGDSKFSYAFRGIDDVYAAVHEALAEHGVHMVPWIEGYERTQTTTRLTVVVGFFADDGSSVTARCPGEGNDSSDKGIGKAISYAMKNLLIAMFAIPTAESGKDNEDSDEPAHRDAKPPESRASKPPSGGKPAASSPPAAQPAPTGPLSEAGQAVELALLQATTPNELSRLAAIDIAALAESDKAALRRLFGARQQACKSKQPPALGADAARFVGLAQKATTIEQLDEVLVLVRELDEQHDKAAVQAVLQRRSIELDDVPKDFGP